MYADIWAKIRTTLIILPQLNIITHLHESRSHWPDFRRPVDLIGGGSSVNQTQPQLINMQRAHTPPHTHGVIPGTSG